MATVQFQTNDTSEAAIFARLWEGPENGFTPELARHVLRLQFSASDAARMHELAEKNQAGKLSAQELDEFDNYVRVGDLVALVQSRARRLLKRAPPKKSSAKRVK